MKDKHITVQLLAWLGLICHALSAPARSSAQEPKLRDTLVGHTDGVTSVAYSPDGKTLASGGLDGTIKLWNVATSKEQATLSEHKYSGHRYWVYCVAFCPDGKALASGSERRTIKLWDV